MSKKKLNRFHIDIYVPEWGRESILKCIKELKEVTLEKSYHAKRKLKKLSKKNSDLSSAIDSYLSTLDFSEEYLLDYLFEFYTNDEMEVKKLCYRIPMIEFDTDVIVVLSDLGKIVTIYTNDNYDKHRTLNTDIYTKKGEIENEGVFAVSS